MAKIQGRGFMMEEHKVEECGICKELGRWYETGDLAVWYDTHGYVGITIWMVDEGRECSPEETKVMEVIENDVEESTG